MTEQETEPTQAADAAASSSAASRLAGKLFAQKLAPALSFAVARASGLLWAEAFGKADLELEVAATPEHRFRLGSVSKVLTSTAAARLASRGVLDLEEPISRWLPELPEPHRATTMRQLLTHRGGVRHYLPRDLDSEAPGGAIFMRAFPHRSDVLELFVDDPLVAPPGTRVTYSSFGYTLASLVMEAAAETEFLRLVDAVIARPFGLASLAADDPWAVVPQRVAGYLNPKEVAMLRGSVVETAPSALTAGWSNIPQINPAFCWAGAGFLMTAGDTARFGAAMLDGPASRITAAERALLFTPLTEATANSPPLGLGWRLDNDARGRRRWHHAGATPGGRAVLVVYPELDLSVAIAGNVMAMPLDVMKASSDLADVFA